MEEGGDINDSNCINFKDVSKIRYPDRVFDKHLYDETFSWKNVRVGVVDEFDIEELDKRNRKIQEQFIDMLRDKGAKIKKVSIPLLKYALPFHFTLCPAEASSNLARYDGIKYGHQPQFPSSEDKDRDLYSYIEKARSEGFGLNVRRRCLLGNFLLSSKFEDFWQKTILA